MCNRDFPTEKWKTKNNKNILKLNDNMKMYINGVLQRTKREWNSGIWRNSGWESLKLTDTKPQIQMLSGHKAA